MRLQDLNTRKFSFNPKSSTFLADMEKFNPFRFNEKGLGSKKALKYMVLMYDKESELIQTITNYAYRKRVAAIAAGFTPHEDGRFPEKVKQMLLGNVKTFNRAMVYFCAKQREPLLLRLAVLEHAQMKIALDAIENYDDKIHKLSDDIARRIIEVRTELFFGEESKEVLDALYNEIDDRELGLEVENIVEKLTSVGLKEEYGELTYGRDYPKPEVKFAGEDVPEEPLGEALSEG